VNQPIKARLASRLPGAKKEKTFLIHGWAGINCVVSSTAGESDECREVAWCRRFIGDGIPLICGGARAVPRQDGAAGIDLLDEFPDCVG